MKTKNLLLISICILFFSLKLNAQSGNSAYNKIKFKEGVYFTSQNLLDQQTSLIKTQLLIGNTPVNSLRSWIRSDSLYYKDDAGKKTSLKIESIFCIYENNVLLIVHDGNAHKVTTVGMISVFDESVALVKAPTSPVNMDQTKEVKSYFADLQSGKVYPYSIEAFEEFLLAKDDTLYKQFMAFSSNKKRREAMYHFIELFNDKHPII